MWNLLLDVSGFTEEIPQSAYGCQLPFQGSLIITSPERGGEPAKLVEGFFCEIFCLMYQVSQKYPSVTCGDSSAQGTPCGCPFRGAIYTKGSLNKNSLPFRGGGPAKLVEGFLWNLLLDVSGFTEVPLSQAYGLPAQHKARPAGALSGEPIFKNTAKQKEHLPQDHSRAEMLF